MPDDFSTHPIEVAHPQQIRAVTPDDFLPPLGQWVIIGGLVMLSGFVGAILLSTLLQYKVVVKAAAVVRPFGEVRLVDAGAEGTIEAINVEVNQRVQAGDILAIVDDSRLQTQKRQVLNTISNVEQQLRQIQAQLATTDQQIAAEVRQLDRNISAAQAELALSQRAYQDSLAVTQANLEETEAAVNLAQDELSRLSTLAEAGVVSQIQLQEKVAALKVAQARWAKVQTSLHPSDAQVTVARERIAQTQAVGESTIARLQTDREERLRQYQELESQLAANLQEVAQLEQELENTAIRAPVAGTILTLNLRNVDQVVGVGEEIAQIAPATEQLTIRALVSSQDINKIAVDQMVQTRISACPYPDYGTLPGTVTAISPDAVIATDTHGEIARPASGQGTYAITILPTQTSLSTGSQDCAMQPGMEGRADIISRQESVLRFVLRKARLLID
ncbi:MAG: HlyD family efflux transporter periplasmic adaptor subunit [Cyanobacteria bacterium J06639_14]